MAVDEEGGCTTKPLKWGADLFAWSGLAGRAPTPATPPGRTGRTPGGERLRLKPFLLTAVVLVLGLASCQQPNTPPANLEPLLDRLDAQGANLDAVRGELVSLREKVEELRRAAVLLDVSVRDIGKLDVATINWGALTGVIVHTSPSTLEVHVEPGECPEELSDGLALPPRNSVVGTSFHPLPAGTYCLTSAADEVHQAVGRTVIIPDGVVAETLLIPQYQPADEEGE